MNCILCKRKKLREAFIYSGKKYYFCKFCTILVVEGLLSENDPNIFVRNILKNNIDRISTYYYPSFLSKKNKEPLNKNPSGIFFSLRSLEYILYKHDLEIEDILVEDELIHVGVKKINPINKVRKMEQDMNLTSYKTFLLWALGLKK